MSATTRVPGPRPDIAFQPIGTAAALFDPMRRRIFTLGPAEAVAWCLLAEGDAVAASAALAAASGRNVAEARHWLDAARAQWATEGLLGDLAPPSRLPSKLAAAATLAAYDGTLAAMPGRITARRRYQLLDSVVEVTFAEADLAAAADAVLPGAAAGPGAQASLTVRQAGLAWAILAEGRVVAHGPRPEQVIPALRLALTRLALDQASGFAAVHAAAVARDGRAVLLPAPGGSGKSTLAAACALAGWELVADDTTVLDDAAGDAWLRPLPHALCLKPGAWPVLAACGAGLEGLAVHERLDGTPARYLPPSHHADARRRLAAIVVPTWVPTGGQSRPASAAVGLRRLDVLAAFQALMPQLYPLAGPVDAAAVQRVATLVERTPCFALSYDRPQDGVRLLGEALDVA